MKTRREDDQLIVVTGAAGMIGSGVVRHLNDLGYTQILLVDDLDTTDKWKNLLGKQFVDWISIGDLFTFLEGREGEIGAFFHLGACSDTLEKNGAYLMERNYRYSVRLAEYALLHNLRFIYASSAATYGDGRQGFFDDPSLFSSLKPLNLYGYSKHLFDLWLQQQGVLDKVVGFKYFNVFGPNENHKGRMASMVYKMVPLIQQQGVLELYASSDPSAFADGEQCRDFIYVKDAVRVTCECLENDISGIFNLGSGQATTWNTLASSVFRAMGLEPRISYIPMPEDLKKQYQNYTRAEMTRLEERRRELGLGDLCRYSLDEAVKDYVQQYLLKDARW